MNPFCEQIYENSSSNLGNTFIGVRIKFRDTNISIYIINLLMKKFCLEYNGKPESILKSILSLKLPLQLEEVY